MGNMSNSGLVRFVLGYVDKLHSDGFAICRDNFIKIHFAELSDLDAGQLEIVKAKRYILKFNINLAREKSFSFLLTSVIHELCHVIQYNESFDFGIIVKNKNKPLQVADDKEDLALNTIFNNYGHTKLWDNIVRDVEKSINLSIPIRSYVSQAEIDQFLKEFFMKDQREADMYKGIIRDHIIGGFTLQEMLEYSEKHPSKETYKTHKIRTNPNAVITHDYRKIFTDAGLTKIDEAQKENLNEDSSDNKPSDKPD